MSTKRFIQILQQLATKLERAGYGIVDNQETEMADGQVRPFGKLQRREDGSVASLHPLIDHMVDVAACFEALCRCRSIRRALESAARRRLGPRDVARLTVIVFLHDLGKANSGFQGKRWLGETRPRQWPAPAGHGKEAMVLFTEELAQLALLLPIDAMDSWGGAVLSLLAASISHHGRPIDPDQTQWHRAVWRPVQGPDGGCMYDPAIVLSQIATHAVDLYPHAFETCGEPLPDAPAFSHLFAGLVQLADWLGSDTNFFPYSEAGEQRGVTTPGYAVKAVASLGLDVSPWRLRLEQSPPTFAETFDYAPYPIQAAMADADLGQLAILESETGSGKTEAALWRFVHLFRLGRVDSLYFALPTRVSASQVYDRIRTAVARLWPDDAPLTVRALPGYAAADGREPKALPDFHVLWPDNPDDKEAHRRWAAESPKRFLAAPVAVGTVDQVLLGALQVRHAHLRHALLVRSLLVVDEVHASDPYMTVLLEHLLAAHLDCGGHALLLSATLGATARDRYLALTRGVANARLDATDYDAALGMPYPAVSDPRGIHPMASTARAKEVFWSTHDAIDDARRIARMALDAASTGAKVLVIRNTVPSAVEVLRELEDVCPDREWLFSLAGHITLHHSRFSRQDRPLLDARIEAELGKSRPSGPRIIVGTQTLEQSLDLDADLLITDLCPMDVLLQRIGRLHRHTRPDEQRPVRFRKAQAWILTPADGDLTPMLSAPVHGLGRFRDGGGVYADLRVVEATRRLIEGREKVSIPGDNRCLVEAATHPEQLYALEQALGEAWAKLGQQIAGDTGAERGIANLHALEIEKPFEQQQEFPADVDIATRLGVRDRLLLFDPAPPGPFGVPLQQLPVRHFLLPKGIDPQCEPEQIRQDGGVVTFILAGAGYSYGRFGLERRTGDH